MLIQLSLDSGSADVLLPGADILGLSRRNVGRRRKDQPVVPAPKTSQHRRRRSRTVIVGSSVEAGALS